MDPNACLTMMLDAFVARDWLLVQECANNLRTWLRCGGFPPNIHGMHDVSREAIITYLDVTARMARMWNAPDMSGSED